MESEEKNIKKLLLEALEQTGDRPEEVRCMFSRRWPDRQSGPLPTMPQSSAADLPEGDLGVLFAYSKQYVYTLDKTDGIKIKTSTDVDSVQIA